MKTTITCLAIAVALRLAFEAVTAQPTPTPPPEPPERTLPNATPTTNSLVTTISATPAPPRAIPVEGKIADEWRTWLWVTRVNLRDHEQRGFDPSFTALLSDYKPIVRKLDNGKWTITFTSEIAEGIP